MPGLTLQHRQFLQRLDRSAAAVLLCAEIQRAKGRAVELPPKQSAPTADQHADYVDNGDLFVLFRGRHRFEVKQLTRNFTGIEDWPFSEVFVDTVRSVDRAHGTVLYYVTFSLDLNHMAIIPRGSAPAWYEVEVVNRNTRNVQATVACPLQYVTFEPTGLPPLGGA